jgi:hypothetical protein
MIEFCFGSEGVGQIAEVDVASSNLMSRSKSVRTRPVSLMREPAVFVALAVGNHLDSSMAGLRSGAVSAAGRHSCDGSERDARPKTRRVLRAQSFNLRRPTGVPRHTHFAAHGACELGGRRYVRGHSRRLSDADAGAASRSDRVRSLVGARRPASAWPATLLMRLKLDENLPVSLARHLGDSWPARAAGAAARHKRRSRRRPTPRISSRL